MSLLLRALGGVCTVLLRFALLPWTMVIWLTNSSHDRPAKAESYATFDHLALNVTRPQTEWLNMGDWSNDAKDLPTASRQLAQRLYRAADIKPGAAILDVGHGCGDSLLLLLKEYKPSVLHGVTSMPTHAKRARQRLEAARGVHNADTAVHCEDAVLFVERLVREADDAVRCRYDVILALDCAYHFNTRKRFLSACQRLLRPGGKVALQDLIASHPYPSPFTPLPSSKSFVASEHIQPPTGPQPSWRDAVKHACVLRLTGVPSFNIVPAHVYLQHLAQAGLCDAQMVDISDAMFPGFARFLRQLGTDEEAMWRGGGRLQWAVLRSFGATVDKWAQGGQHGMVRSVVVVAHAETATTTNPSNVTSQRDH